MEYIKNFFSRARINVQKYEIEFNEDIIHNCLSSKCIDYFIPSVNLIARFCIEGQRKGEVYIIQSFEPQNREVFDDLITVKPIENITITRDLFDQIQELKIQQEKRMKIISNLFKDFF